MDDNKLSQVDPNVVTKQLNILKGGFWGYCDQCREQIFVIGCEYYNQV